MRAARFATLVLISSVLLSACVAAPTAAEKRAANQQKCSDYGYAPGSDRFADCMMQQDIRAERKEERKQDMREHDRALSLERSGDERFPVCGAATPNSHLDSSGFWFGPDCRAR